MGNEIERIERWRGLVTASYAHNSRLYAAFAASAGAGEILSFLQWDAFQPPFHRYLEQWRAKAPASIRAALESHIREEIDQDHSGLFAKLLGELARAHPSVRAAPDPALLHDLNYTFSPECAAAESFGFFSGGFFATEIMSAKRCEQLLKGLRRAGIAGSALRYLELHAENDVKHVEEVTNAFLLPWLRSGGSASEVEKGIADRLARSERFVRWYEEHEL